MQKKWLIKDAPNLELIEQLQHELKVERIVAQMLVNRGIKTYEEAKQFFRPSLTDLHDPFLMKNMEKAVERLQKAVKNKEKVLIYGDYDVDGTTAVALMFGFLKSYLNECAYYIPDRYKEGYGISEKGVQFAKENGFTLMIALDCGIKAVEEAELAKSLGIDLIICDHHTPGEILPDAIVLDPKQEDCNYPYNELSGCGVGFKLLTGFATKANIDFADLAEHLDLLAISIGADIVPITGENRTLCALGLEKLNKTPRLGLEKLLNLAKKELPLTLTNVVFIIAPRINAAGRMGDAKTAVELLTESNSETTTDLAKEIHHANEARKLTDEEITAEAIEMLEQEENHNEKCTNVVFQKGWHKGVIGIVASRIIETYYRPTIVFTQPEGADLLTGSARSIKGINIYDVLDSCSDLIANFGGHYYAAGLSILPENYSAFCNRFNREVEKIIDDETLIPEQILESELTFDEIFPIGESLYGVPRIKRIINQFEPHGPGNMKPVFLSQNVYVREAKLLKGLHLKLKLYQPSSRAAIDAILFNRPDAYEIATSGEAIKIVYTMEVNEWRDKKMLQFNLKDIRPQLVMS